MKQVNPSIKQIPQCQKHEMDFDFVCLDQSCQEEAECCVICIKENHTDCQDGLIVEKEFLPQLLEYDSTQKIEKYVEAKNKIYENSLKIFEDKISLMKNNFQQILGKNENIQFNEETIMLLKTFFIIKKNSAGDLEFTINNENQEKQKENFTRDIQKINKDFLDAVKELKIENTSDLAIDQFHAHPYIAIKKESFNSLIFSRNTKSQEYNYFCAIDKKPLTQNTKIQIKILGIQKSDPYLDIGVIDQSKFNQLSTDPSPRISFNTAKSSFCGTSICNIQGNYSGANFEGRKILFEFNQSKRKISFTSSDNLVNLTSQDLGSQNLYFYITLYHPATKCSIKKMLI